MARHIDSKILGAIAIVFCTAGLNPVRAQEVVTEKQISLPLANAAAMATIERCRTDKHRVTVTVVDRGGNIKAVLRDDGAGLHTVDTSYRKAFTALTFQIPTSEFVRRSENNPGLRSIEGAIALAGGLPIRSENEVIGAIGVGGAPSGDADAVCAQAGIDSIANRLQNRR